MSNIPGVAENLRTEQGLLLLLDLFVLDLLTRNFVVVQLPEDLTKLLPFRFVCMPLIVCIQGPHFNHNQWLF